MDVYLSAVGNRMNEVMKFLTVISTIFIPDFCRRDIRHELQYRNVARNMPELNWYCYPLCLAVRATAGWFSSSGGAAGLRIFDD